MVVNDKSLAINQKSGYLEKLGEQLRFS